MLVMTLLTTAEAAERLALSTSAVNQMLHRGQLPEAKRGKYNVILIDDEVVEAMRRRRADKLVRKLDVLGYDVVLRDREPVT